MIMPGTLLSPAWVKRVPRGVIGQAHWVYHLTMAKIADITIVNINKHPWSEILAPRCNVNIKADGVCTCDPEFDLDDMLEAAAIVGLDRDTVEKLTQDIFGCIGCPHCGETVDEVELRLAQQRLIDYLAAQ